MIDIAPLTWRRNGRVTEFLRLSVEARAGLPPAAQLTDAVESCAAALEPHGLTLDNIVHQRLWLRERGLRREIDVPRAVLFGGSRRSASSSFMSATHFQGSADIALDLLIQRPLSDDERRLVDFAPARRYAWYLLQDGWLHLSGMAEEGATMDEQFDAAFGQAEAALSGEGANWRHAQAAHLFLERGRGEEAWLRETFARRSGLAAADIRCDLVDGLASPGKHLEIEIVASLR